MSFIFDALAAAALPSFGEAALAGSYMMGETVVPIVSGAAGSSAASGAVNAIAGGAATAGTSALLTDKPEIKFPEIKGPGKPTAPPGAPLSPSDTAAVQRAKMRSLPKSTILTRSRSRSSGTTISRSTLSSGSSPDSGTY